MDSKQPKALLAKEREEFRARVADRKTSELWVSLGKRVAVVLSGGGARGPYQAGVLLALQDGQVPTHILTATSVGSINAASYAANSETVVGNAEPLVESWLELTSPAVGIEWTRYVFLLSGFVAAVVGIANLFREWLHQRGVIFIHLHNPKLTWLFLALAGISILLLHDRLSYVGYVAGNLLRRRPWKPERGKLALSLLANAAVWGLVFVLLHPAHVHFMLDQVILRYPKLAVATFPLVIVVLVFWRFFRARASQLSHKFLRLPLRTGLFPNFERARLLRERIAVDRLRASPMRVVITATDVEEGTERFFSNASHSTLMADPGVDRSFVAEEIEPAEDLMKVLIASSAMPILYEAVAIGQKLYTDGSVVVSQPIRPAIRLGADMLFLVMTRPRNQRREEVKTFLDLGLRVLEILMAQNLRTDLKILNDVNRICEKQAAEIAVRPEQVNVAMGARIYRYLKVFIVCPEQPLAAGLLDFDSKTAGTAILQGYCDGCKAVFDCLTYAAEAPLEGHKYVVRLALDKAT
jgi:predicted acylesterase/phospholipase RssA